MAMAMAMVRATLKIPQYLFDMLMAAAAVTQQKSVERYRGSSIIDVCVEMQLNRQCGRYDCHWDAVASLA
jgi:hypothetical protein